MIENRILDGQRPDMPSPWDSTCQGAPLLTLPLDSSGNSSFWDSVTWIHSLVLSLFSFLFTPSSILSVIPRRGPRRGGDDGGRMGTGERRGLTSFQPLLSPVTIPYVPLPWGVVWPGPRAVSHESHHLTVRKGNGKEEETGHDYTVESS